jgi:DNA-binding HxlR family transcriptional regulator
VPAFLFGLPRHGLLRNMSRKPPIDLDERLINHVANNPSGVGVEELLRLLTGEVSRRTLQRRLSALIRAGRLINKGAGPSTIYLLPKPTEIEEIYVPLSPSGATARAKATERAHAG